MNPKSPRQPHLYVTRAATLEYQQMTGAGFETARLALTTHLLGAERQRDGSYLAKVKGDAHRSIRARTVQRDGLLIVTKIEEGPSPLDEDTPTVYPTRPAQNTRRRRRKRA